MKQRYLISIVGKQRFDDDSEDEIELVTTGSYSIKDNKKYIIYQEYSEDSPSSKTTSVLKVENDQKVTVIRNGAERSRLILEEGKRYHSLYSVGFQNMTIGVFTDKVISKLDNHGGSLKVSYSLDINSDLTSQNQIFIEVKEIQQDNV